MSLPELFSNDLGQKYWSTVYAQEVHCNVFQKYQNGNNAGLALIADANGFGTWLPLTGSGGTGGLITVTGGTGINVTELAGNFTVTNEGVVSVTGGTGITVSGLTGAVTISGTGVLAVTGATGILVSGGLGNEIVTNIGVVSVTGGTGITVSGSTGAVVIFTQDISGVTNTDVSIAITQSGSQASVQATGQFPATTNQLILGTTNKITINSTAPASSYTYLLADPLQNAVFMAYTGTSGSTGTLTTLLGPRILEDPVGMNLYNGTQAGQNEGGTGNSYFGFQAGGLGTGPSTDNCGFGRKTLNVLGTGASSNNAFGVGAIQPGGTGVGNCAFGKQALGNMHSGFYHSVFGHGGGFTGSAGMSGLDGGTGCVLIGGFSNVSSNTAINRIAIGFNATNSTNNTAILGNTSLTDISSNSTACTLGVTTPFSGISFVNSGGTAGTLLSFYQETTQGNTASGIWASNQNSPINYTRIGRMVFITFSNTQATSNTASGIAFSANVPVQYRPGNQVLIPIDTVDGSANSLGVAIITSAGVITMFRYSSVSGTGNFTGSGTAGFQEMTLCYAFGV